jgi:hypothetical protein
MAQNNTIEKFLESFDGKELDNFDAKQSILIIKEVSDHIPSNGEYDPAIVSERIGQYIHAIKECGKILASLGLVEAYQETEVDKEFSRAALERAFDKGIKTAGERKLYAQSDEQFISAKNKLNEIKAVMEYIENYRTSLNLAHLHCKKIIDRNKTEEEFAKDHERYGGNNSVSWVKENDPKFK